MRRITLILTILIALCAATGVWSAENSFAEAASDSAMPFILVGELALQFGGENGRHEAMQGAKAVLATAFVTEVLKLAVHAKRPTNDSHTSFPSGHTSTTFAMATVIADYKPEYKWIAYGTASVIAWSRVEVGAHYTHDVIAGAALGYLIAKRFTKDRFEVTPQGVEYSWRF